jgi:uncharacterized membrane protein
MTSPKDNDLVSHPPSGKVHITHQKQQISLYKGPIPPADELIKYERACPGAADRIIAMAERQSVHRQGLEDKVISGNVQNEKVGMWLAFIITAGLMGIGTYLIMNNKEAIGFAAIFVPCLFQACNYAFIKYKEHKNADPKKPDSTAKDQPPQ